VPAGAVMEKWNEAPVNAMSITNADQRVCSSSPVKIKVDAIDMQWTGLAAVRLQEHSRGGGCEIAQHDQGVAAGRAPKEPHNLSRVERGKRPLGYFLRWRYRWYPLPRESNELLRPTLAPAVGGFQ